MSSAPKALKAQNIAWIWGVVLADAMSLVAVSYPTTFNQTTITAAAVLRVCSAAIAPVAVLLVTSLLPSDTKAVLIFWRLRDALPGHRAFSVHALHDPRIDIRSLRKNIGDFPRSPRDQNSSWYRLYKAVESEVSVALPHRQYLLFRDLAVVSLMLAPIAVGLLLVLGAPTAAILFSLGLFLIQYFVAAVAARNQGVRLVTSVLALYSASGRT